MSGQSQFSKTPTVRYDSHQKTVQDAAPPMSEEEITSTAERHRIPLYEDPNVIEALARLDMSSTVPVELYGIIAEVLGFVYRLDASIE